MVALILLCALSAACHTPETTPQTYFRALEAFDNGRLSDAERCMSLYSEAYPGLALPKYWLGLIELERGKTSEAREHFEDALRVAPQFWPALDRLGYLEISVGNVYDAIRAYGRLRELRPKSSDAFFRAGLAEIFALEGEKSARDFLTALKLNPANVPAAGMGMFPLQYLDDLEDTVHVLQLASQAVPRSSFILNELAQHYTLLGKLDKAEATYMKAMEVDPTYSKVPMDLASLVYIPAGRYEQAAAMLRRAIKLEPTRNSNRLDLGTLYLLMKRYDESEAVFKDALTHDPLSYVAYLGLGKVAMAEGNLREAEQYLRRAVEIEPGYKRAHLLLSILYRKLGCGERADVERKMSN